ncbi:unnamed protein product [Adineta steineri]|uniref:G-protein coupled receptors family 1 profile domain-containing protein n=1 Tax=Adineta steineri TaxID=433720 RepID=A0A819GTY2_9BILA|nr:unnamed protein product [Adineta steineri]CAF0893735.1 unnamed protein product [Adineta steineri]CAF0912768.1 unnamed protein product [Adineta steineri]CAF3892060.1 unnamed protein product [Adineta steineri]CAF3905202.1 unnamed protein product [Adineta steineri]
MNNISSIIIDVSVFIFALTGALTSIGILILIFCHRHQCPINTATRLICNNYLAGMISCLLLLDTYAHNLYGVFHENISFNNWWCYARSYLVAVGLAALYHSYLIQAYFRLSRVVFYKRKQLYSSRFMFRLILIQWLIDFLVLIPSLILQHYDYMPQYYYCQILYTNWRGIVNISIIVYYFPMTVIGSIYFYIVYYMKQNKSIAIQQNRQLGNQRDLTVLRRILILIGMLCMLSFPSVVLYFWYLITGYLIPWIYHFQWLTFTLSLAILPIATACLTPQLRELFILKFRQHLRIHPIMEIQQTDLTTTRQETL